MSERRSKNIVEGSLEGLNVGQNFIKVSTLQKSTYEVLNV